MSQLEQASRETAVSQILSRFDNTMSDIQDIIGQLEIRVSSLVGPTPPSPVTPENAKAVGFTDSIFDRLDRLARIRDTLRTLEQRL